MLHILAKTATPSSKCKEICSSRIIISYIGSSNDGELQNQEKKNPVHKFNHICPAFFICNKNSFLFRILCIAEKITSS